MDINNLKKVEIGCGKTKTEGYIGVDRFPLEGVDIVADINNGLPFETNSVDVIFACHSLEHMDDLQQIMDEIFRICKNGAIINILSPYYNTHTNIANFFHKINFNEDTMRFFSTEVTSVINPEEYRIPHAQVWGLGTSDNSEINCNLTILDMEFFYFPEYNFLNDEEKRNARRSLNNVCDQISYSLVVNKQEKPFELFEIEYYRELAKKLMPPIVSAVRNNSNQKVEKSSFYKDIVDRIKIEKEENSKLKEEIELLNVKLEEIEESLYQSQNKLKEEINNNLEKSIEKININLEESIVKIDNNLEKNIYDLNKLKTGNDQTAAYIQELMILNQSKKKNILFRKNDDLFDQINLNWGSFCDDLVIKSNLKENSILSFSKLIPFDKYIEYKFEGSGTEVNYFISAKRGSLFMIEVVNNGKIIYNNIIEIENEGHQVISIPEVSGETYIRFKAINNSSLGRILEIKNRKYIFFIRSDIAAYLE